MDTITLLGRVLVSLAAVLGLMWIIARRMRAGGKSRGTQLIEVLGRQQVSRGASVAVVRVGEQALVLGVTDNQVAVLGDTDLVAARTLIADNQPAGRRTGRKAAAAQTRATRVEKSPVTPEVVATDAERPGALAGSALSLTTWKQTIESLRDLTARSD